MTPPPPYRWLIWSDWRHKGFNRHRPVKILMRLNLWWAQDTGCPKNFDMEVHKTIIEGGNLYLYILWRLVHSKGQAKAVILQWIIRLHNDHYLHYLYVNTYGTPCKLTRSMLFLEECVLRKQLFYPGEFSKNRSCMSI